MATGQKLVGTDVTIKMAKAEKWYDKDGSKWKTMPQQMLAYRAAAFFIRTCAPEISMGLPTSDELEDIGPVNVTDTGSVKDVVEKVEAETAAAMEQPEVVTPEPAEAPAKPERPF